MYENLSEPMPLQKEIKLYTGTGNPALSEKIADILHLELQGLQDREVRQRRDLRALRRVRAR